MANDMRITAAPVRVAVHTRPIRPRLRHRRVALLGLLLVLPLVGASFLLASALSHPAHAQVNQAGADDTRMRAAVTAAQWPQKNGVWCGVSDIAAIASYRGTPTTQDDVVAYLTSAPALSAWGTPAPNTSVAYGPGFPADISRDGGTDPRSMAAGLTGLAHGSYHTLVDYHSAYNATVHLIADLVRTREPITVFVNAASHSVLVSAVHYYGSDPTNLNNVTELEIWDSGAGAHDGVQPYDDQWVPLHGWLTWYAYYGATYHANIYDGRHALDPDPSVGPYTYDPSQGRNIHLWIGHYVYIHPDAPGEASQGVSPDWAFNQDGALIRGLNGETPAGFSGPSVPMYIPPPPPPPRSVPTATATPIPTNTPRPRRDPPDPAIPPAKQAAPTPAPSGSFFGLSLQSVCIGAPCTGAQTASTIALGSASSLGAALLVLAGIVTVRRRKRRGLTPSKPTQPPGEVAETTSQTTSQTTSASTATPADSSPTGDAPDASTGETTNGDGEAALGSALSVETSPLARLAHASERLERLATESGAPEQALDPADDGQVIRSVGADAAAGPETTGTSGPATETVASAEPDGVGPQVGDGEP